MHMTAASQIASAGASDCPSVLLVHADQRRGADFEARMRNSCGDCRIAVLPPRVEARPSIPGDVDVVLVPLDGGMEAVVFAAALTFERPWLRPVFIGNRSSYPEAEALHSLGARYVTSEPEVWRWLPGALLPLSRHARASRLLLDAEQAIPPPPPAAGADTSLPLAFAEQRFREAYLRTALAGAGSHKAAALVAGVPYATLRSMTEKLQV
jgi:hypothetical protein